MSQAQRRTALMTVDEFYEWAPPRGTEGMRWQLIDGEPVCMAPASENHGAIQSEAAALLRNHLRAHRPACRVITAPGVIPPLQSSSNARIPDLGVTCAPPSGARAIVDPVVLIEILSPSNASATRSNVWAYCSIPSVREVLLLSGAAVRAELLRRDDAGRWPSEPAVLEDGEVVELRSIAFSAPLRDFYATTSLAV